jgi:hypothetical protein
MKFSNPTIIIVSALIVAGGAYWYFFTGTGNEPPLTTNVPQNGSQTQFQALVGQLQSISFDTSIFSEQNFMMLTDLATPVAPEASGRSDPFASIPGISAK